MSTGIRVRLRRSSATEFEIKTDPYELIQVVRGPPIKIYVRRLQQVKKEDKKKPKEEPPIIEEPAVLEPEIDYVEEMEPEPEEEPEAIHAKDVSSEDEKVAPSEDRLTSRQRSLKQAQEAEDEEDEEDEDEEDDEEEQDLGPISKEEAALRKSEMRRRRRLALDKIEEQAKQETIERLLKKTSVRKAKSDKKRQRNGDDVRKSAAERRLEEIKVPHPGVIRYRNFIHDEHDIATVTLPDGYSLNLQPVLSRPEKKARCGCGKPRLYSCSKTSKPLCSLNCYQQLHMKS